MSVLIARLDKYRADAMIKYGLRTGNGKLLRRGRALKRSRPRKGN